MRSYAEWMGEYAKSHTNPQNQLIHKICVPVIFFNVLAILWFVPLPGVTQTFANLSMVLVALGLLFYVKLKPAVFLTMIPIIAAFTAANFYLSAQFGKLYLYVNIGLFVIAWIGQFIGHKIEGAKPSFIDDLFFLLIGPVWVLRKFGVNL